MREDRKYDKNGNEIGQPIQRKGRKDGSYYHDFDDNGETVSRAEQLRRVNRRSTEIAQESVVPNLHNEVRAAFLQWQIDMRNHLNAALIGLDPQQAGFLRRKYETQMATVQAAYDSGNLLREARYWASATAPKQGGKPTAVAAAAAQNAIIIAANTASTAERGPSRPVTTQPMPRLSREVRGQFEMPLAIYPPAPKWREAKADVDPRYKKVMTAINAPTKVQRRSPNAGTVTPWSDQSVFGPTQPPVERISTYTPAQRKAYLDQRIIALRDQGVFDAPTVTTPINAQMDYYTRAIDELHKLSRDPMHGPAERQRIAAQLLKLQTAYAEAQVKNNGRASAPANTISSRSIRDGAMALHRQVLDSEDRLKLSQGKTIQEIVNRRQDVRPAANSIGVLPQIGPGVPDASEALRREKLIDTIMSTRLSTTDYIRAGETAPSKLVRPSQFFARSATTLQNRNGKRAGVDMTAPEFDSHRRVVVRKWADQVNAMLPVGQSPIPTSGPGFEEVVKNFVSYGQWRQGVIPAMQSGMSDHVMGGHAGHESPQELEMLAREAAQVMLQSGAVRAKVDKAVNRGLAGDLRNRLQALAESVTPVDRGGRAFDSPAGGMGQRMKKLYESGEAHIGLSLHRRDDGEISLTLSPNLTKTQAMNAQSEIYDRLIANDFEASRQSLQSRVDAGKMSKREMNRRLRLTTNSQAEKREMLMNGWNAVYDAVASGEVDMDKVIAKAQPSFGRGMVAHNHNADGREESYNDNDESRHREQGMDDQVNFWKSVSNRWSGFDPNGHESEMTGVEMTTKQHEHAVRVRKEHGGRLAAQWLEYDTQLSRLHEAKAAGQKVSGSTIHGLETRMRELEDQMVTYFGGELDLPTRPSGYEEAARFGRKGEKSYWSGHVNEAAMGSSYDSAVAWTREQDELIQRTLMHDANPDTSVDGVGVQFEAFRSNAIESLRIGGHRLDPHESSPYEWFQQLSENVNSQLKQGGLSSQSDRAISGFLSAQGFHHPGPFNPILSLLREQEEAIAPYRGTRAMQYMKFITGHGASSTGAGRMTLAQRRKLKHERASGRIAADSAMDPMDFIRIMQSRAAQVIPAHEQDSLPVTERRFRAGVSDRSLSEEQRLKNNDAYANLRNQTFETVMGSFLADMGLGNDTADLRKHIGKAIAEPLARHIYDRSSASERGDLSFEDIWDRAQHGLPRNRDETDPPIVDKLVQHAKNMNRGSLPVDLVLGKGQYNLLEPGRGNARWDQEDNKPQDRLVRNMTGMISSLLFPRDEGTRLDPWEDEYDPQYAALSHIRADQGLGDPNEQRRLHEIKLAMTEIEQGYSNAELIGKLDPRVLENLPEGFTGRQTLAFLNDRGGPLPTLKHQQGLEKGDHRYVKTREGAIAIVNAISATPAGQWAELRDEYNTRTRLHRREIDSGSLPRDVRGNGDAAPFAIGRRPAYRIHGLSGALANFVHDANMGTISYNNDDPINPGLLKDHGMSPDEVLAAITADQENILHHKFTSLVEGAPKLHALLTGANEHRPDEADFQTYKTRGPPSPKAPLMAQTRAATVLAAVAEAIGGRSRSGYTLKSGLQSGTLGEITIESNYRKFNEDSRNSEVEWLRREFASHPSHKDRFSGLSDSEYDEAVANISVDEVQQFKLDLRRSYSNRHKSEHHYDAGVYERMLTQASPIPFNLRMLEGQKASDGQVGYGIAGIQTVSQANQVYAALSELMDQYVSAQETYHETEAKRAEILASRSGEELPAHSPIMFHKDTLQDLVEALNLDAAALEAIGLDPRNPDAREHAIKAGYELPSHLISKPVTHDGTARKFTGNNEWAPVMTQPVHIGRSDNKFKSPRSSQPHATELNSARTDYLTAEEVVTRELAEQYQLDLARDRFGNLMEVGNTGRFKARIPVPSSYPRPYTNEEQTALAAMRDPDMPGSAMHQMLQEKALQTRGKNMPGFAGERVWSKLMQDPIFEHEDDSGFFTMAKNPFGAMQAGRGTIWGNPFAIGMPHPDGWERTITKGTAGKLYEEWLRNPGDNKWSKYQDRIAKSGNDYWKQNAENLSRWGELRQRYSDLEGRRVFCPGCKGKAGYCHLCGGSKVFADWAKEDAEIANLQKDLGNFTIHDMVQDKDGKWVINPASNGGSADLNEFREQQNANKANTLIRDEARVDLVLRELDRLDPAMRKSGKVSREALAGLSHAAVQVLERELKRAKKTLQPFVSGSLSDEEFAVLAAEDQAHTARVIAGEQRRRDNDPSTLAQYEVNRSSATWRKLANDNPNLSHAQLDLEYQKIQHKIATSQNPKGVRAGEMSVDLATFGLSRIPDLFKAGKEMVTNWWHDQQVLKFANMPGQKLPPRNPANGQFMTQKAYRQMLAAQQPRINGKFASQAQWQAHQAALAGGVPPSLASSQISLAPAPAALSAPTGQAPAPARSLLGSVAGGLVTTAALGALAASTVFGSIGRYTGTTGHDPFIEDLMNNYADSGIWPTQSQLRHAEALHSGATELIANAGPKRYNHAIDPDSSASNLQHILIGNIHDDTPGAGGLYEAVFGMKFGHTGGYTPLNLEDRSGPIPEHYDPNATWGGDQAEARRMRRYDDSYAKVITGGPGTGKSAVDVSTVVDALTSLDPDVHTSPHDAPMIVTFGRKATNDMKRRVFDGLVKAGMSKAEAEEMMAEYAGGANGEGGKGIVTFHELGRMIINEIGWETVFGRTLGGGGDIDRDIDVTDPAVQQFVEHNPQTGDWGIKPGFAFKGKHGLGTPKQATVPQQIEYFREALHEMERDDLYNVTSRFQDFLPYVYDASGEKRIRRGKDESMVEINGELVQNYRDSERQVQTLEAGMAPQEKALWEKVRQIGESGISAHDVMKVTDPGNPNNSQANEEMYVAAATLAHMDEMMGRGRLRRHEGTGEYVVDRLFHSWDLISKPVQKAIEQMRAGNRSWASQFSLWNREILMGEAQDVNLGQMTFAEQFTGGLQNLTLSADPNQTIFSFRGAVRGIFQSVLDGAQKMNTAVHLQDQYRMGAQKAMQLNEWTKRFKYAQVNEHGDVESFRVLDQPEIHAARDAQGNYLKPGGGDMFVPVKAYGGSQDNEFGGVQHQYEVMGAMLQHVLGMDTSHHDDRIHGYIDRFVGDINVEGRERPAVVLARTNKEVAEITQHLEKMGLPVVANFSEDNYKKWTELSKWLAQNEEGIFADTPEGNANLAHALQNDSHLMQLLDPEFQLGVSDPKVSQGYGKFAGEKGMSNLLHEIQLYRDWTKLPNMQNLDPEDDRRQFGVHVMTGHTVKGLEFELGFIPNATEASYPTWSAKNVQAAQDTASRMNVALTRAGTTIGMVAEPTASELDNMTGHARRLREANPYFQMVDAMYTGGELRDTWVDSKSEQRLQREQHAAGLAPRILPDGRSASAMAPTFRGFGPTIGSIVPGTLPVPTVKNPYAQKRGFGQMVRGLFKGKGYAEGGMIHDDGLAMIGEKGREVYWDPSQNEFIMANEPMLIEGKKGGYVLNEKQLRERAKRAPRRKALANGGHFIEASGNSSLVRANDPAIADAIQQYAHFYGAHVMQENVGQGGADDIYTRINFKNEQHAKMAAAGLQENIIKPAGNAITPLDTNELQSHPALKALMAGTDPTNNWGQGSTQLDISKMGDLHEGAVATEMKVFGEGLRKLNGTVGETQTKMADLGKAMAENFGDLNTPNAHFRRSIAQGEKNKGIQFDQVMATKEQLPQMANPSLPLVPLRNMAVGASLTGAHDFTPENLGRGFTINGETGGIEMTRMNRIASNIAKGSGSPSSGWGNFFHGLNSEVGQSYFVAADLARVATDTIDQGMSAAAEMENKKVFAQSALGYYPAMGSSDAVYDGYTNSMSDAYKGNDPTRTKWLESMGITETDWQASLGAGAAASGYTLDPKSLQSLDNLNTQLARNEISQETYNEQSAKIMDTIESTMTPVGDQLAQVGAWGKTMGMSSEDAIRMTMVTGQMAGIDMSKQLDPEHQGFMMGTAGIIQELANQSPAGPADFLEAFKYSANVTMPLLGADGTDLGREDAGDITDEEMAFVKTSKLGGMVNALLRAGMDPSAAGRMLRQVVDMRYDMNPKQSYYTALSQGTVDQNGNYINANGTAFDMSTVQAGTFTADGKYVGGNLPTSDANMANFSKNVIDANYAYQSTETNARMLAIQSGYDISDRGPVAEGWLDDKFSDQYRGTQKGMSRQAQSYTVQTQEAAAMADNGFSMDGTTYHGQMSIDAQTIQLTGKNIDFQMANVGWQIPFMEASLGASRASLAASAGSVEAGAALSRAELAEERRHLGFMKSIEPIRREQFDVSQEVERNNLARQERSMLNNRWLEDTLYGAPGSDQSYRAWSSWNQRAAQERQGSQNAGNATYLAPTSVMGLENQMAYRSLENQRSMLIYGQSSLSAGAAYEEQMDFLKFQEQYQEKKVEVNGEQRKTQREIEDEALADQKRALEINQRLQREMFEESERQLNAQIGLLDLKAAKLEADVAASHAQIAAQEIAIAQQEKAIQMAKEEAELQRQDLMIKKQQNDLDRRLMPERKRQQEEELAHLSKLAPVLEVIAAAVIMTVKGSGPFTGLAKGMNGKDVDDAGYVEFEAWLTNMGKTFESLPEDIALAMLGAITGSVQMFPGMAALMNFKTSGSLGDLHPFLKGEDTNGDGTPDTSGALDTAKVINALTSNNDVIHTQNQLIVQRLEMLIGVGEKNARRGTNGDPLVVRTAQANNAIQEVAGTYGSPLSLVPNIGLGIFSAMTMSKIGGSIFRKPGPDEPPIAGWRGGPRGLGYGPGSISRIGYGVGGAALGAGLGYGVSQLTGWDETTSMVGGGILGGLMGLGSPTMAGMFSNRAPGGGGGFPFPKSKKARLGMGAAGLLLGGAALYHWDPFNMFDDNEAGAAGLGEFGGGSGGGGGRGFPGGSLGQKIGMGAMTMMGMGLDLFGMTSGAFSMGKSLLGSKAGRMGVGAGLGVGIDVGLNKVFGEGHSNAATKGMMGIGGAMMASGNPYMMLGGGLLMGGAQLYERSATVRKAVGWVGDTAKDLWNSDIAQDGFKKLKEFADFLKDLSWDDVKQAIKDFPGKIKEFFTDGDALANAVKEFFHLFFKPLDLIIDKYLPYGEEITALVGKVFDTFVNIWADVNAFILSTFGTIASYLLENWNDPIGMLKDAWGVITGAFDAVWDYVSSNWDDPTKILGDIWDLVTGTFSGIVDWLKDNGLDISGIFGEITAVLGTAVSALGQGMVDMINKAIDYANKVLPGFLEIEHIGGGDEDTTEPMYKIRKGSGGGSVTSGGGASGGGSGGGGGLGGGGASAGGFDGNFFTGSSEETTGMVRNWIASSVAGFGELFKGAMMNEDFATETAGLMHRNVAGALGAVGSQLKESMSGDEKGGVVAGFVKDFSDGIEKQFAEANAGLGGDEKEGPVGKMKAALNKPLDAFGAAFNDEWRDDQIRQLRSFSALPVDVYRQAMGEDGENIRRSAVSFNQIFEGVQWMFDSITKSGVFSTAYEGIAGGIKSVFGAVEATLTTLAQVIRQMNQVIGGGDPESKRSKGFASGTMYNNEAGMYLVGEAGTELVHLPQGARVYNAAETSAMQGETAFSISPDLDAKMSQGRRGGREMTLNLTIDVKGGGTVDRAMVEDVVETAFKTFAQEMDNDQ